MSLREAGRKRGGSLSARGGGGECEEAPGVSGRVCVKRSTASGEILCPLQSPASTCLTVIDHFVPKMEEPCPLALSILIYTKFSNKSQAPYLPIALEHMLI